MKYILNFMFLCLLVSSCKKEATDNGKSNPSKSNSHIEVEYLEPSVFADSLFTSFPGPLIVSKDYVIWQDPFAIEGFLKIIDKYTGNQIAETGTIGQGPLDFNTPSVFSLEDNILLISDINTQKQAQLSIDSLLLTKEAYVYEKTIDLTNATVVLALTNCSFISLCPILDVPFQYISNNKVVSFGKYPITKKISNSFENYQGQLAFNKKKQMMVYSPYFFPSLYLYEKSNESYDLKFENVLYEPEYTIADGELRIKNKVVLINEIAMTKDYIVAIQKKEYDKNKIEDRNSPRPTTLYLYNYELELVRIVDIKLPLLRLAGDEDSNTIYCIVTNPEHCIVKVEL